MADLNRLDYDFHFWARLRSESVGMGPFEEQFFWKASQETIITNELRCSEPGSKEGSFFGRFCWILPSVGLVYYCLLGNCGTTASTSVSAFACVDYIETNPTTK